MQKLCMHASMGSVQNTIPDCAIGHVSCNNDNFYADFRLAIAAGALIVVVAVCSFLAGFMYHRRRSGVSATSSQMVFLSDSGEDSAKESLELLVDRSGKHIILGQGSFGKVCAYPLQTTSIPHKPLQRSNQLL